MSKHKCKKCSKKSCVCSKTPTEIYEDQLKKYYIYAENYTKKYGITPYMTNKQVLYEYLKIINAPPLDIGDF